MPDKLLVTVPLPIGTLTGTPLQIYPHPPSHPCLGFIPLGFIQTRSIQNVMLTCWQCSQYPFSGIVATSSTVATLSIAIGPQAQTPQEHHSVFTVPNSRSVVRQQRKLAPRPSRRLQFHCLKGPLKLKQVPGTRYTNYSSKRHI